MSWIAKKELIALAQHAAKQDFEMPTMGGRHAPAQGNEREVVSARLVLETKILAESELFAFVIRQRWANDEVVAAEQLAAALEELVVAQGVTRVEALTVEDRTRNEFGELWTLAQHPG